MRLIDRDALVTWLKTIKLNRFKTLTRSIESYIQDESVRDTLLDLANYALMTILELDKANVGRPT